MALHRDIHWIGRQWAVTGYGMQAIDQRYGGRFDIEVADLWDEDLLERLSGQKWFNLEDFAKGLALARKRYPEPPREPESEPAPAAEPTIDPPPLPVAPPLLTRDIITPPPKAAEVLEPEAPKVEPIKQNQSAPSEDLLKKWFEAYGLSKTPASVSAPEPPPEARSSEPVAKAPEQAEPIAAAEHVPRPELPVAASVEPPARASPFLQMPIPARARFVRPWRVQIHSVQSYQ
jgi:hypothetical protein